MAALTRQSLRLVDALPRPGLGHLGGEDGEPRGGRGGLLLEAAHEGPLDVLEGEGADGRPHQPVHARGEHGVELRVIAGDFVHRLCWGGGTRLGVNV